MPLRTPTSDAFYQFRAKFPCEGEFTLPGGLPIIPDWLRFWYSVCWPDGEPAASTILDSRSKKGGKSADGGAALAYVAIQHPGAELYVASADQDQSRDRILRACKYGITNSDLANFAEVRRDEIVFSNGSFVRAISSDWKSAAGSNARVITFDEMQSFVSEQHHRLVDELVVPASQPRGLRLIASYAGWSGQSTDLERFWTLAHEGELIENPYGLPVRYNERADLLSLIDTGPESWRMPWTTPEFIERVRITERPSAFKRQYLNQWTAGEDSFVDPEAWAACFDPELRLLGPTGPRLPSKIYLAADASVHKDHTALVGVTKNRAKGRIEVAYIKVWKPKELVSGGRPTVDLDAVGAEVIRLHKLGVLDSVSCDPYQLAHLMQVWQATGITIHEFPQTSQRIEADEALADLIRTRNIAHTNDPELNAHIQAAVGREGPRGTRIDKGGTRLQIDAAVSLSMAAFQALTGDKFHHIKFLAIAGDEFNKRVVTSESMSTLTPSGKKIGPIARNAMKRKEIQARYFADASEAAGRRMAKEYSRMSENRRLRIRQLAALGMEPWAIARQLSIKRQIIEEVLGEADLPTAG